MIYCRGSNNYTARRACILKVASVEKYVIAGLWGQDTVAPHGITAHQADSLHNRWWEHHGAWAVESLKDELDPMESN